MKANNHVTFTSWFFWDFTPLHVYFLIVQKWRKHFYLRGIAGLRNVWLWCLHCEVSPSLWSTQCHHSKPWPILLGTLEHRGYNNYFTATQATSQGDWEMMSPLKDGPCISVVMCIMWMTGNTISHLQRVGKKNTLQMKPVRVLIWSEDKLPSFFLTHSNGFFLIYICVCTYVCTCVCVCVCIISWKDNDSKK